MDIHLQPRILALRPGTGLAPSGGSAFAPPDVSSPSLDAPPEGAIPSADFTKALGAISLGVLPPASDPMAPPSADLIASMKLMLDASATLAGMGAGSVPTVAVGMTAADAMRQERFFRDAIDAASPPAAVGEFTGNFSGSASFGGPNSFATGGTLTISGDFAQAANMTGQATITSGGAGSLALSGFSASQGTFSNVNSLPQGATLTDGINTANVTSMNLQGAHTATTATGNWNMGLSTPGSASGSFNVAK
ncbi:MAG TPA: hypothetical protein VL051_01980 [Burkholderiaceae bacterium]|nr:hypothetical protein [Burkholderiaceae bacterium]